jgi:transposase InsO family protein
MDCYSRRIVGWAIADPARAELVGDLPGSDVGDVGAPVISQ